MIQSILILFLAIMSASASGIKELPLFRLEGGKKVAYQLKPDTKYVAFYQSASWCPPCVKLTPLLVQEHGRMSKIDTNTVEIIMIGEDRSEKDVLDYMGEYGMTWPAVEWHARSQLGRFRTREVPHLMLVEIATGHMITRGCGLDGIPVAVERMREFSGVSPEEEFDDTTDLVELFSLSLIALMGGIFMLVFLKWRQSKRSHA